MGVTDSLATGGLTGSSNVRRSSPQHPPVTVPPPPLSDPRGRSRYGRCLRGGNDSGLPLTPETLLPSRTSTDSEKRPSPRVLISLKSRNVWTNAPENLDINLDLPWRLRCTRLDQGRRGRGRCNMSLPLTPSCLSPCLDGFQCVSRSRLRYNVPARKDKNSTPHPDQVRTSSPPLTPRD